VLNLDLQPSSPVPLYRQIVDQIERAVAAGVLESSGEVPSVRSVADAHAINPMTVSKAYALLEARGVLERRKGIGMFVRTSVRQGETAKSILNPILLETATAVHQLRIPNEQAIKWFRDALTRTETGERRRTDHKGTHKP
jgi:GntR family transcriptional regulator